MPCNHNKLCVGEHDATAFKNVVTFHHPLRSEDAEVLAAMRISTVPNKGKIERLPYDDDAAAVLQAAGITYAYGIVGSVWGVWCHPIDARVGEVVICIHGGAYVAGSAYGFRHLAGQLSMRSRITAFVPEYSLAPEHPFPAALDDVRAVYRGMVENGTRSIAIAGDSAGGGLALALLSTLRSEPLPPRACAVLSPWTDLAMTGASLQVRDEVDPLLAAQSLSVAAAKYLNGRDARDPLASPLYDNLSGLPPLQIHVGSDEILFDDARRYAERADAGRVDAELHIWDGMVHGFAESFNVLVAGNQALNTISAFLRKHLDRKIDDTSSKGARQQS